MDSSTERLRLPDGFIERGASTTRLEAFVDASFAQIMMFWAAHATCNRRFGLDDSRSHRWQRFTPWAI